MAPEGNAHGDAAPAVRVGEKRGWVDRLVSRGRRRPRCHGATNTGSEWAYRRAQAAEAAEPRHHTKFLRATSQPAAPKHGATEEDEDIGRTGAARARRGTAERETGRDVSLGKPDGAWS